MSTAVSLVEIAKRFGDSIAVEGVSIDIADGEFFSLLGPSGSGKTTALRMIVGFESPPTGRVFLHGAAASARPGDGGRRNARVRALFRRDHRDDVHRRQPADSADLDLLLASPAANRPVADVVAMFVVVITFIPIVLAQRYANRSQESQL